MLRLGKQRSGRVRVNQIVRINAVQRLHVPLRKSLIPRLFGFKYFVFKICVSDRGLDRIPNNAQGGHYRERDKKKSSYHCVTPIFQIGESGWPSRVHFKVDWKYSRTLRATEVLKRNVLDPDPKRKSILVRG